MPKDALIVNKKPTNCKSQKVGLISFFESLVNVRENEHGLLYVFFHADFGAVPPCLANEAGVSLAGHGIPTEGEAGGLSIDLVCKSGKGVLARISRVNGKFKIVVVRCEVVQPDASELEARRHECGIPFWPHAFVNVDGDAGKLVENWNNEYGCLGYGEDLYDQIIDFGNLMGIEVVAF